MKKSLEILNKEGLAECTSRHKKIAHATQSALEALGFPLFVKQPHLKSNTVTAAFAPIGLDASLLLKKLNQNYGLTVTGGQGEFKGKMIRVGHIGAIDEIDLFGIFGALEMALNEMDYNFELGSSSRAINKTIDRRVIPYA